MNTAVKKGLIWGLALTVVGVGIYFLIKKVGNKGEEDYTPEIDEEDRIIAAGGTTSEKVELDAYKWLKKGSKNIETKYLQWGINEIIKTAKMIKYWKPNPTDPSKKWYDTMNSADKRRIDALAGITPLKGDGDFGAKTLAAVKIVEGKSETSYCNIRSRRSALAKKYDFKDPYGNIGKKGCNKRMVTA
ncbi:MAG: hypothetical protein ACXAAH_15865 [Promethearchaeota archaeon]|jgi:hypothetical protein